jgi:addiction module RelE/StbE family toxin
VIIWTTRSQIDLREVHIYISESNEPAAERVAAAIRAAGNSLMHFPRRGRHGKQSGTRELVVQSTPYYLVYHIRRDGDVVIRRVMHMARDWPRRR